MNSTTEMKRVLSELVLYICNHITPKIPSNTFRLWFYAHVMNFSIGRKSTIFLGCKFDCSKGLTIGSSSVINSNCRLDNRGTIIIGNNVSISQDVIILTADHDLESREGLGRNLAVLIEDYVWIGTRAMILPGVTIGKGAVVAAGAVVTKNVSQYSIVAGVPAKHIKSRMQDLDYDASYRRLFQ